MTNERINIKIAGLCGHPFETKEVCRRCRGVTPYEAGDDYGITLWEECRHCNNTGKVAPYHVGLLNYAADLNACHEFEKLTAKQCREGDYWFYLREILGFPDAESDWDKFYFFQAVHATARQRCEAFLRVHNQWEEEA